MRLKWVWWIVLLCIPVFVRYASNTEEASALPTLDESFDSGGFNAYPWIMGGDTHPFLQSQETLQGNYSLQFGAIGVDQRPMIEIQVELHTPK